MSEAFFMSTKKSIEMFESWLKRLEGLHLEFKTAKRGWLKLHLNRGFFGSERLQLAEMSNLITVQNTIGLH